MRTEFKDLQAGQYFDWIDPSPAGYTSFYRRCRKISARRYVDSMGYHYNVGTIHAEVFHVEPMTDAPLPKPFNRRACTHPPARLYSWTVRSLGESVLCVVCLECHAVLAGGRD